jgi:hypothetical protein
MAPCRGGDDAGARDRAYCQSSARELVAIPCATVADILAADPARVPMQRLDIGGAHELRLLVLTSTEVGVDDNGC